MAVKASSIYKSLSADESMLVLLSSYQFIEHKENEITYDKDSIILVEDGLSSYDCSPRLKLQAAADRLLI